MTNSGASRSGASNIYRLVRPDNVPYYTYDKMSTAQMAYAHRLGQMSASAQDMMGLCLVPDEDREYPSVTAVGWSALGDMAVSPLARFVYRRPYGTAILGLSDDGTQVILRIIPNRGVRRPKILSQMRGRKVSIEFPGGDANARAEYTHKAKNNGQRATKAGDIMESLITPGRLRTYPATGIHGKNLGKNSSQIATAERTAADVIATHNMLAGYTATSARIENVVGNGTGMPVRGSTLARFFIFPDLTVTVSAPSVSIIAETWCSNGYEAQQKDRAWVIAFGAVKR